MPRKRGSDAPDVVVSLAREQPAFAVALLPKAGEREGEQGQRAALALDLGQPPSALIDTPPL